VFGNGPSVSEELRFTTAAQPDRTKPVISGVQFLELTNTSVLVSWNTDEPADSAVDYGTSAYYDRNQTSRLFTLAHAVLITGLLPGTTYHFSVRSTDPSGNPAQASPDLTFTTLRSTRRPAASPPRPRAGSSPMSGRRGRDSRDAGRRLYLARRSTVEGSRRRRSRR